MGAAAEFFEGFGGRLARVEAKHRQDELPERPEEALHAAAGFGFADGGRERLQARQADGPLKAAAQQRQAVVMAEADSACDALREAAPGRALKAPAHGRERLSNAR